MGKEEFDSDKVTLDDVRNMDESEFRLWSFLRVNDLLDMLDKVEGRQWFILSGIIITILLSIILVLIELM